jgi:hypothetical protein
MKIKITKTFKWCVNSDIYPKDYIANNVYEISDFDAHEIITAGYAVAVSENEVSVVVEDNVVDNVDAGWEEGESPFTEETGSELSVLQQEQALQEKTVKLQKPKNKKAGE